MSETLIAPATEQEIPVLLDFIRALADYEKMSDCVSATEEKLRQTLFSERPGAEAILARWHGEYAGFAVFFSTYSTFWAEPGIYLEDVFVKPHLRGKGVGLALLRYVARLATQRGCRRVEWSVLNWNEPSIAFYSKLGAVPLSEWAMYRLTGDALIQLAQG